MKSYIIEGGKKLEGTVKISGSKNASLPILAATILSEKTNKLYNVPQIKDTKTTLEILKLLGCKIKQNSGKIEINSKHITKTEIPEHLMREMRSTVIMAGALLGRFKEVTFSYPGGCDIGSRPIDLHINAFKKLGVEITEEAGFIKCKANKIIGTNIDLDFPSVGATENIILATVLSTGTTTINNAAMEPEIIDMVQFLKKMGAKIQGEGTNQIIIDGVEKLSGVSYNIMPDRIEAGTILCAVAATGGNVTLDNVMPEHLTAVINKLEETGCKIEINNKKITLNAPKKLKSIDIKTMTYPGFPTDLQQIFATMLVKASGTSIIVENIFESRYKYISELRKMGAKVTVEGKTAIIKGTRKINATTVVCTDLRGGAALVIAGLMAKGKSRVENIGYIQRGYENLENKLGSLGAKIKLEESN
ncbi:uDP-N-acetylglucosamine 1-carboxyvinyltransferase 1 [Clostridium sp. CAG:492]|jgi:UDP-N-acetylglucosamine 1-carboxyvinyltransferase|nr:uDP-N-acetylglucosamine 1-carboxyvinyltransferase 1 [Clostridium sp. CAG:492]